MFYTWRSLKTGFQFVNVGKEKDESTSFSGQEGWDKRCLRFLMQQMFADFVNQPISLIPTLVSDT